MISGAYVFVDVETTGVNAARGRVIEVAAIRVENGEVVKTFTTLIDPEMPISYQITQITGITDGDVAGKPTFRDIADELFEILEGAVFVAHNVRFDYSFLKQEYRRLDRKFSPKQLCTVKLSRNLYPEMARHRLSDVITHHGFSFDARHRAYDDANVLVQFWQKIQKDHPLQVVQDAVAKQMKRPSIPRYINHAEIDALPHAPGVYVFHDAVGDPIYIGKSIDIKARVLSHFLRDVDEQKEYKISQLIRSISHIRTTGELSALLLESAMIKEKMPLYNRRLRRLKKLTVTKSSVDASGYAVLSLEELSMDELPDRSQIIAMHPRRSAARASLDRHIKTFELCPKLCGAERGKGPCFAYQLGKCRGACVGAELPSLYNARVEIAYQGRGVDVWPHEGAVLIVEHDDETGEQTGFVVDNWIIQAKLQYLPDMDVSAEPYQELFDLDAYTILRNYLLTRGERVTITPYRDELS
jgi:DNA polymerase-3 subunit epsilon